MIRYDCFEWLAPLMTDQLVVTSLSGQRVEWGHLSKREADLNLGSMGNALAVGIGLALVRKAVQRMEGEVWAESTPGAGATFCTSGAAARFAPT